jgi:DNA-binding response OmpR family regulator
MLRSTDPLHSRILIVDDAESNVRLLEYTLRRAGYVEVSSTSDPLNVCELHRAQPFDLILLDLQMPRMNGFEVLEQLKGEVSVPVLMLTAVAAQMIQSLAAGAEGFLSKPFMLNEVLLRVAEMLALGREMQPRRPIAAEVHA